MVNVTPWLLECWKEPHCPLYGRLESVNVDAVEVICWTILLDGTKSGKHSLLFCLFSYIMYSCVLFTSIKFTPHRGDRSGWWWCLLCILHDSETFLRLMLFWVIIVTDSAIIQHWFLDIPCSNWYIEMILAILDFWVYQIMKIVKNIFQIIWSKAWSFTSICIFMWLIQSLSFSSCYKFPFRTHDQNYPWRMCRMCEVSVLYSESHSSAVTLGGMLIVLWELCSQCTEVMLVTPF